MMVARAEKFLIIPGKAKTLPATQICRSSRKEGASYFLCLYQLFPPKKLPMPILPRMLPSSVFTPASFRCGVNSVGKS